ncbi:MAG TPA: protoporphyrinogen oxidase [Gemmatimonadota bacterium]|nr:protoporphyrinogen oxidase [Gemmatimonadota bacterium]
MIGIVGAGLTGLALAHELARRGIDHVVLEAADRPGGVIRSDRVEGRVLELGPQRGRMTADLSALVAELGIAHEVIYAPPDLPLFVYADGTLRPVSFSAWSVLASDLLTWRGKLRLALEPFTAGPRDDERVARLLTRKLGREAYERLVGPLYGGLYASDPANMVVGLSLGHVLREFGVRRSFLLPLLKRGGSIDAPRACSFVDGMQTLTDALHGAHARSVRLATPARGLARAGNAWTIELDGGTIDAEVVVLTCDARGAAGLLSRAAPKAAERLGRLVYNPLGVVHLHAETDLRGLGYQVGLGEDLATRGVTWNDSLFGREGVYTAYLGGARNPAVVDETDATLGRLAADEFRLVTGYEARVLAVARERMPAWDVSWRALEGLELPHAIRIAANWMSRPGIPGRLAEARRLAERLG